MASVTRSHPDRWRPVARVITPEEFEVPQVGDLGVLPGVWYDFADPTSGVYGQCLLREDGTWSQAPLGEAPVILEWLGREDASRVRLRTVANGGAQ